MLPRRRGSPVRSRAPTGAVGRPSPS
jgi:hypothetical protein